MQQKYIKELQNKDTSHKKEVSRLTRLMEKLCLTIGLGRTDTKPCD